MAAARVCPVCGCTFKPRDNSRRFCSWRCSRAGQRRNTPRGPRDPRCEFTHAEIAAELGVCRQRVGQILKRATVKIADQCEALREVG